MNEYPQNECKLNLFTKKKNLIKRHNLVEIIDYRYKIGSKTIGTVF